MTTTFSKRMATLTRMTAMLVAGVVVMGAMAMAQSDDAKMVGTWKVQVTLYNCVTGQQGQPFGSMLSFNRGGTLIGTTSNSAFQPGQRTSDYGSWSHVSGNTYKAASEAYILFSSAPNPPAPGFSQGSQRITQSITLNGDQFTSVATVQFLDPAGNVIRAGCATATGQRFQ